MEPTLIVIALSAIVLAFPLIKGVWDQLNGPEIAKPEVAIPAPQGKKINCLQRLMDLAECLPEEEREDLVNQYAARLMLKELE